MAGINSVEVSQVGNRAKIYYVTRLSLVVDNSAKQEFPILGKFIKISKKTGLAPLNLELYGAKDLNTFFVNDKHVKDLNVLISLQKVLTVIQEAPMQLIRLAKSKYAIKGLKPQEIESQKLLVKAQESLIIDDFKTVITNDIKKNLSQDVF